MNTTTFRTLILSTLLMGGCLGEESVECLSDPPVGDASADTIGKDTTMADAAARDSMQLSTVVTMDAAKGDASPATTDAHIKSDAKHSNLDDGLCWYKHECPVGHFKCTNDDATGSPIADAQCLTKRNLCFCCDAPIPAFSCME